MRSIALLLVRPKGRLAEIQEPGSAGSKAEAEEHRVGESADHLAVGEHILIIVAINRASSPRVPI